MVWLPLPQPRVIATPGAFLQADPGFSVFLSPPSVIPYPARALDFVSVMLPAGNGVNRDIAICANERR